MSIQLLKPELDADVLILCGGLGTRLRAELPNLPKPLAPVDGKPFLEHLLLDLARQGASRVVLSTGYGAEAFDDFVTNWDGPLELVISREEIPLGTGGGVKLAESQVRGNEFLVMNGDSYCGLSFGALLDAHRKSGARVTLATSHLEDVAEYGSVEVNADGLITAFREKTGVHGPGLINAGIYVINRGALAELPAGEKVSLERDFFPALVGRGLYAFATEAPVLDIGTPERLRYVRSVMTQRSDF